MPSQRVLVLYGSKYGQTAKVAERICALLREHEYTVDLLKGDALPRDFDLDSYDAVLIGASLIGGHHQRYIERFASHHRNRLNRVPSAFFSVSGSAGSARAEDRAAAQVVVDRFLAHVGWMPSRIATFAGAITFTRYNVFLRWSMKRISRKEGGSTDTSRDHEYTDWARVARFVDDIALLLADELTPRPQRIEDVVPR